MVPDWLGSVWWLVLCWQRSLVALAVVWRLWQSAQGAVPKHVNEFLWTAGLLLVLRLVVALVV